MYWVPGLTHLSCECINGVCVWGSKIGEFMNKNKNPNQLCWLTTHTGLFGTVGNPYGYDDTFGGIVKLSDLQK